MCIFCIEVCVCVCFFFNRSLRNMQSWWDRSINSFCAQHMQFYRSFLSMCRTMISLSRSKIQCRCKCYFNSENGNIPCGKNTLYFDWTSFFSKFSQNHQFEGHRFLWGDDLIVKLLRSSETYLIIWFRYKTLFIFFIKNDA